MKPLNPFIHKILTHELNQFLLRGFNWFDSNEIAKKSFNSPCFQQDLIGQKNMSDNILRINQVIQKTGLSRSVIYEEIKNGRFPKQVKLAKRSSGWLESEINKWIKERIAERDAA